MKDYTPVLDDVILMYYDKFGYVIGRVEKTWGENMLVEYPSKESTEINPLDVIATLKLKVDYYDIPDVDSFCRFHQILEYGEPVEYFNISPAGLSLFKRIIKEEDQQ